METIIAALVPLFILLFSLKLMMRTLLSPGAWDVMVGVLARDFVLWSLRLVGWLFALPFRLVAWLICQLNA